MTSRTKNPDAEALAGSTAAIGNEPAPEDAKPSLVELGMNFAREFRASSDPERGQPADKAFIDSLYEDD
jgi:antitoxin VapB